MENADRKCATIQTQKQSKSNGQTIYIYCKEIQMT